MAGALLCTTGIGARAAPADEPIAVHSMLQLDDPRSFMQAMFAQAAAMHAAYLRMDVAPALVFPAPGQPPDFRGLCEVVALSQQYRLPVVADLLTVPYWIAACPQPRIRPMPPGAPPMIWPTMPR